LYFPFFGATVVKLSPSPRSLPASPSEEVGEGGVVLSEGVVVSWVLEEGGFRGRRELVVDQLASESAVESVALCDEFGEREREEEGV
jgi:hypothetical protein